MAAGMGGLEGLLGGLAAGGALDAIWENPMAAWQQVGLRLERVKPEVCKNRQVLAQCSV